MSTPRISRIRISATRATCETLCSQTEKATTCTYSDKLTTEYCLIDRFTFFRKRGEAEIDH